MYYLYTLPETLLKIMIQQRTILMMYITKKETKQKVAANWIEVGAMDWHGGEDMAAEFSNYGKKMLIFLLLELIFILPFQLNSTKCKWY